MVNDAEPRYRLVDGNGNVIGSVYADPDGTLKLQEGSGSDNEASLQPDGTFVTSALETENATINHGLTRGRNGERIDASKYDDATPEARLNSALADAVSGDVIYLENAGYGSVTIGVEGVVFVGTAGISGLGGTEFTGGFTVTGIENLFLYINGSNSTLNIDAESVTLSHCNYANVQISGDRCAILNSRDVSLTFESGTSSGMVDSCFGGSNVTDNGNNYVGDVS